MSFLWIAMLAEPAAATAPVAVSPPPPMVSAAPPPSARLGNTIPIPRGNPGEWVTSRDYPASALRLAKEGVVGFRLTVSPEGRVSDCTVTVGSGAAELDETACRLIAMRAAFSPARDAKGNPVMGYYSNRVRWTIPQGVPAPVAGLYSIAFVVEKDGSQSDCRVVQATGSGGMRAPVGPLPCPKRPIAPSYTDTNGNPVRKRVTITETTTLENVND